MINLYKAKFAKRLKNMYVVATSMDNAVEKVEFYMHEKGMDGNDRIISCNLISEELIV